MYSFYISVHRCLRNVVTALYRVNLHRLRESASGLSENFNVSPVSVKGYFCNLFLGDDEKNKSVVGVSFHTPGRVGFRTSGKRITDNRCAMNLSRVYRKRDIFFTDWRALLYYFVFILYSSVSLPARCGSMQYHMNSNRLWDTARKFE